MIRLQRVLGIGVVAFMGANALSVNILLNPGFESGVLAPWVQTSDFGGPENWNVTTADAFTGSFSATDVGNKLLEQSFGAVATSDINSLSFALKNVDGTVNAIYFRYSDLSTEENIIFHTDGEWHVYDMTSFLDAGKSLVAFGVYGVISAGPTDRTYLDDAVVDVVPEPASMAALGVGVVALIRKRRKAN